MIIYAAAGGHCAGRVVVLVVGAGWQPSAMENIRKMRLRRALHALGSYDTHTRKQSQLHHWIVLLSIDSPV